MGLQQRLHNSLIFVVHHVDLQVRDRLEGVHQLEGKKWKADWQRLYGPFSLLFMQAFIVRFKWVFSKCSQEINNVKEELQEKERAAQTEDREADKEKDRRTEEEDRCHNKMEW